MKFTIKKERKNGTGISSYIIEPDLYLCMRVHCHIQGRGKRGGGSNFIYFLYKVLGKRSVQKGPF